MKPVVKAHLAVFGTNLFFAGNYSLIKLISPQPVGPFAVNVLRVGFSLLLFWFIWLFGKTDPGIKRKDWGRFFLCGLTGITINQLLFVKGLTLTSTVHASLLILITPIIVTIFALWVLKEKFTLLKALGLSLGIGGSVFLILQKETSQHAPNYLFGDLLILANALFYSIYFILVKPLMETYSPLHVIRWVFTIGFFLMLPIAWNETLTIQWQDFQLKETAALLSVTFLGTFLAYFFNAYGLQHLGASTTGAYIYTQPVFAVLIASFILNETVTAEKLVAAVFIFAGVYLVSRKNKI